MFYQIQFIMLDDHSTIHAIWTNPQNFPTKEDAMRFAQNTAKGFNGSNYKLFYRILL